MLVKKITYTDYNDNKRTEEFCFHLSKAELSEMEVSAKGGLMHKINTMVEEKDTEAIFMFFKDLIGRSYGVKSEDGRRFIKSKEITESFYQTEAYSVLLMEIMSSTENASAFVNGIIPHK